MFYNFLHGHLLAFFLHNLLWSLNSLIDVNFLLSNYAWRLYRLVFLNVFNNWSRDIVLFSTGQDVTISALNENDAVSDREFRSTLDFLWLWLRWCKSRLVLDVKVHWLVMFLLLIRGCSRDVRHRIRLVQLAEAILMSIRHHGRLRRVESLLNLLYCVQLRYVRRCCVVGILEISGSILVDLCKLLGLLL